MRYIHLFALLLLFSCNNSKEKSVSSNNTNKDGVAEKQESVTASKKDKDSKKDSKYEGMVYLEGGAIIIGSNDGLPNEYPAHEVNIKPFYIDKHLVTVSQFRKFITATGYVTDADSYGDAGVYSLEIMNWSLVKGANWEYPLGPDKPKAEDNHPVTQVSWSDAVAYAKWTGKRLLTEFEWEFAAKNGGNTNNRYSWGDNIYKDGKFFANVWQGELSEKQGADGYIYTSPVGSFGETKVGLTDMGGNVWQWCGNTYELYPGNKQFYRKNENVKAIRGGSFFFDQAGEASYTVTFRAFNSKETSLFNMGFRCASNAE